MPPHPHLIDPTPADSRRFTSPLSGPRERFNLPERQRAAHAERLLGELAEIAPQAEERAEAQRAEGIDAGVGIYLVFDSDPDFELKFESLEFAPSGIELCAVKRSPNNGMQAVVFVPDGRLAFFLKRIEAYRDADTSPAKDGSTRPKNQDLVESVSHIRLAALEALWTDSPELYPEAGQAINWEVWLRRSGKIDHLARLRTYAERFDLTVDDKAIRFIDRVVVLVRGTAEDVARSVDLLGAIAEVRLAKDAADFFTTMNPIEQRAWVEDLAGRLAPPADGAPYVCLLDTGVNSAHPLLTPVVRPEDLHSYKPAWGVDDRHGHGTPMAGLAAYGDLTELLASLGPVPLTHRLESVKIINRNDPHEKELYGAVTQESAYRVEVTPGRSRVFCLSVTAKDGRDRGKPSSWSAAVDSLAFGGEGENRQRLFVLSAGNTEADQRRRYPESNMTDGVHDPAQAWNALTVGGYTEKAVVDGAANPGWNPLAQHGDLAPCSCTSATWKKTRWPIKPDIVLEAGNMAVNDAYQDPDYLDELQLLSTHHRFTLERPLTTFGDTSAAAAIAACMAGALWAKYPDFTPETIRALMVHAAEWTPAMVNRFTDNGVIDSEALLRCFGYGTPDFRRLMSSADDSLTLIAQGVIQPFFEEKKDGKKSVKTREMRLHRLPWPTDILRDLGNAPVIMGVTLSYFVEPSPGDRGWASKYGYQSFGLRFAVKRARETVKAFEDRINRHHRDEDYEALRLGETGQWRFGHASRALVTLGSLHSDAWSGPAVDLAAREYIAVFPTMGWWNKRPQLGAWQKQARYSLVVTIATPGSDVDIYTPVANEIGVPVVVEV
ncbi:S8 family peptidase [Methyloceanibacter sp.]|uniref:S8 family peptidase n=1 Tax=Methyloceanibacter sp. TaxID=1965321 RepID=UPI002C759133|nr:S8 family peptidase [Methyloceanibacter sp.]HML92940.1 S8 family peptidase [Methyloceanibacter sp.]